MDGWTPLHEAVCSGNKEVSQLLLDFNADPMVRTEDGDTVLHKAARWNRVDIVKMLLYLGVDTDARDSVSVCPRVLVWGISNDAWLDDLHEVLSHKHDFGPYYVLSHEDKTALEHSRLEATCTTLSRICQNNHPNILQAGQTPGQRTNDATIFQLLKNGGTSHPAYQHSRSYGCSFTHDPAPSEDSEDESEGSAEEYTGLPYVQVSSHDIFAGPVACLNSSHSTYSDSIRPSWNWYDQMPGLDLKRCWG